MDLTEGQSEQFYIETHALSEYRHCESAEAGEAPFLQDSRNGRIKMRPEGEGHGWPE